jgi:hypothetical protein
MIFTINSNHTMSLKAVTFVVIAMLKVWADIQVVALVFFYKLFQNTSYTKFMKI